jgi:cytosine/adenosine deaminase-related metal-dependent hydrolase
MVRAPFLVDELSILEGSFSKPLGTEIGNMQSGNYNPEDVFWGELGGCLEALDAGTTTLVDHAHVNISAAHSQCFFLYHQAYGEPNVLFSHKRDRGYGFIRDPLGILLCANRQDQGLDA